MIVWSRTLPIQYAASHGFPALDRLARVEEAEPAEPCNVGERRRLGLRQVDRLAEDGAEALRAGAEVRLGREGDVDLEAALEQEDAVESRAGAHIPVVDCIDGRRPVRDHVIEVGVLGNAQEDVDVRPSILAPEGRRAGHRSARDPLVSPSPLEQALAYLVALLRREHARPARRAATRPPAPTRRSGQGAS